MPVLFLLQSGQPCKGTQTALSPGTCPAIYKIQIPATRYHIGKRESFYLHKSGYVIMTN